MSIVEINKRYSVLAQDSCCLSCGGAINHSKAQAGETCLDLGSGRGTDVLRLAEEVGEDGMAYGIDISDGMIEKARQNASKFDVKNANFIKCELAQIPLPSGIVDLIISNCTINHADDKLAVWQEIFRLLKDGGRFVVSDIYATSPIADEYRTDPEAIAECWAGSTTRDEYLETLSQAGFKAVSILEESKPYAKGKAEVCSWTISATKPVKEAKGRSCCR